MNHLYWSGTHIKLPIEWTEDTSNALSKLNLRISRVGDSHGLIRRKPGLSPKRLIYQTLTLSFEKALGTQKVTKRCHEARRKESHGE